MQHTSTFRRMLGTGLGALVLGVSVVTMAAPAGAADAPGPTGGAGRHRVHLTTEQRECMKQQGITRPDRPLTAEKIQQIKDAAKACDIKLPARRHLLTDEQKQCLADHGVTRPIRPLTKDKVQVLKDAAKACDIKLPHRRHLLTAEQRQCMQQQGITRPVRPLTAEKIQQIKDAAAACNIQLPQRFGTKAAA